VSFGQMRQSLAWGGSRTLVGDRRRGLRRRRLGRDVDNHGATQYDLEHFDVEERDAIRASLVLKLDATDENDTVPTNDTCNALLAVHVAIHESESNTYQVHICE